MVKLPYAQRRGAVMTVETLIKLGIVAAGMLILFAIYRVVADAGDVFQRNIQQAPWKRQP
jgi:hypothetical protein